MENADEGAVQKAVTVDTQEFREKLKDFWMVCAVSSNLARVKEVRVALIDHIDTHVAAVAAKAVENERAAKEHSIQQSQQHAMEARTQRETVLSILRHFGLPENDSEALTLIKTSAPQQPAQVEHRPGCDALGGYGHGFGPCSCGAQQVQSLPKWIDDAKGKDSLTDDLIAYIEGTHFSHKPAQAAQPSFDQAEFDALVEKGTKAWAGIEVGRDAQAALSDAQIKDIATAAVRAGKVSWLGYEKDEDGKYTIPALSPYHYQFARAILAASQQPAAAPNGVGLTRPVGEAKFDEKPLGKGKTTGLLAGPNCAAPADSRIAEQVAKWRKEVDRLTDLIAHATGEAPADSREYVRKQGAEDVKDLAQAKRLITLLRAQVAAAPAVQVQDADVQQIVTEVNDACVKWPPFNSAHEGFAVLKEEVDELWDHVKVNQKRRDLTEMKKEAKQVAAMALRFMRECCDEITGRK